MYLITEDSISKHKGKKNLEKREVRSHNKVRALFTKNKHVRNNYAFEALDQNFWLPPHMVVCAIL